MNKYFFANELINRFKNKDDIKLMHSEYQVNSQSGEDGVICEIIRRIFIYLNKNFEDGYFFEFGAETGAENNCSFLADYLGWAGTFIESNSNNFISLNKKYFYNKKVNTLNEIVSVENIQNLINNVKSDIDIISIDIDGEDYWIWNAVESRPKVVCIEYNASLIGKKTLKRGVRSSWDGTTAYGASIDALRDLGLKKGYVLVYTNVAGVNAFFVKNEFKHLFPEHLDPEIRGPNYLLQSLSHTETDDDVFMDIL